MSTQLINFNEWRSRLDRSAEQVIDNFFGKLELTTHETSKALFASLPEKRVLIEEVLYSLSLEEAPLRGVPYMLQDMFDVHDLATRCGAGFQDPFEAPLDESCLLYQKLKADGACFFAKTVPAEFGVDQQGRNRSFGNCPHRSGNHKIGGGGAGASIRAVSDGWVPLAFGLDTCGGMRIPTAFHGLFNYRMITNNYARDGVFPIVPSIESVGWTTNNLEDLATVFTAFNGHPNGGDKPLRGLIHTASSESMDSRIKIGLHQVVRPLDIDEDPWMERELTLLLNEAANTLATLQARELYSVHRYWLEEYRDRYDSDLLRIIETGKECSPQEAEACDVARGRIRARFIEIFQQYDFIVLPVCPLASPQRKNWSPQIERETLRLMAPASVAMLPVLTLPFHCGVEEFGAAQVLISPKHVHNTLRIIDALSDSFHGYNSAEL
ncbi:amidase family protein [Coraliomargarita parva]|uniref:amidase family protein n=1 Tax=Coraliomargarita parva TaxID=3014050 RepID=UPI0022B45985|nr:amidase family protein [Coraliomargarita parva]